MGVGVWGGSGVGVGVDLLAALFHNRAKTISARGALFKILADFTTADAIRRKKNLKNSTVLKSETHKRDESSRPAFDPLIQMVDASVALCRFSCKLVL